MSLCPFVALNVYRVNVLPADVVTIHGMLKLPVSKSLCMCFCMLYSYQAALEYSRVLRIFDAVFSHIVVPAV